MLRFALAVGLAALTVATAPAQAATERPIVYVIVLDGLDGDAVDDGSLPFVSSLLGGEGASSTYFRESRSVIPAETNPNHTAMMTGAYPGVSGIAGNAFALYAPLEDEDGCKPTGPFDFSKAPTPTSGESAECLLAETVFAAVQRQDRRDRVTTAAIFGKPKLGRIFAGDTVRKGTRDADHLWAPCDSGADDDDYCGPVPTNPITGYAVDDATVMDEVVRTVEQGIDPDGERPDFTFVNLHQIDSAGHASGRGPLYDFASGQADDEIERLVSLLRTRGEWDRTVMMLVSDHSMDTTLTKISMTDSFDDAGDRRRGLRRRAERQPRCHLPRRSHEPGALRAAGGDASGGAGHGRRDGGAVPRAQPDGRRRGAHDRRRCIRAGARRDRGPAT